jgi:hypothetical protein
VNRAPTFGAGAPGEAKWKSANANSASAPASRPHFLEVNLDSSYISALAALAGAAIGGLTSFATTWTTQRMQIQHEHRQAEKAALEALYSDFIVEAARVLGDAWNNQTDDVTALVRLYAMVGRMDLVSDRAVIEAAKQVVDKIIETYLGPNRALHEVITYAHNGGMDFLHEFSEACRKDLDARATTFR